MARLLLLPLLAAAGPLVTQAQEQQQQQQQAQRLRAPTFASSGLTAQAAAPKHVEAVLPVPKQEAPERESGIDGSITGWMHGCMDGSVDCVGGRVGEGATIEY
jgi:lipopolysaccharide biosynthesis regulator YciM